MHIRLQIRLQARLLGCRLVHILTSALHSQCFRARSARSSYLSFLSLLFWGISCYGIRNFWHKEKPGIPELPTLAGVQITISYSHNQHRKSILTCKMWLLCVIDNNISFMGCSSSFLRVRNYQVIENIEILKVLNILWYCCICCQLLNPKSLCLPNISTVPLPFLQLRNFNISHARIKTTIAISPSQAPNSQVEQ